MPVGTNMCWHGLTKVSHKGSVENWISKLSTFIPTRGGAWASVQSHLQYTGCFCPFLSLVQTQGAMSQVQSHICVPSHDHVSLSEFRTGKADGTEPSPPLQHSAKETKRDSSTGTYVHSSAENSLLPKSTGTVGGTSDGSVKNVL